MSVAQGKYVEYSISELAKYFGVSTNAINNWIEEGRFLGVKSSIIGSNLKISEIAVWVSAANKNFTVKEVIEMWKGQYSDLENLEPQEEHKILLQEIAAFEKRYGGTYEATLKIKDNKTYEDERIEDEWLYLLERCK